MTAALIFVATLLLALLVAAHFTQKGFFRAPAPAGPARRAVARAPAAHAARSPAPAPPPAPSLENLAKAPAPRLQMLEWDDAPPPLALGAAQLRVRDRYIAARFPGVMTGAADLSNGPKVIEAARLYFDERKFDRAHEVLQLAVEVSPREASLRLAQIEIAFLKRDNARFLDAARALRAAIPDCPEWNEVQRLGHALAPDEQLFGASSTHKEHEHYGPWPDMPNWIGASWDLTAEIRAADFHQAMSRSSGHGIAALLRSAA